MMMAPTISVAVLTRNSHRTIARTLESILQGNVQPLEIIVVDGMSDDQTVSVASQYPVRIVKNRKRKIAPGRNIGLQEATGEIVAYTDSDCVVALDWCATLAATFDQNPSLDCIGGKMVALEPANAIEAFAGHTFLDKIMCYSDRPIDFVGPQMRVRGAVITANCAYRKQALVDIGGFDEWFGNTAEDIDLFWRLLVRGYRIRYLPNLIVYHEFPRTVRSLCRKSFGFGVASSRLTKRHRKGKFTIDAGLYRDLQVSFAQFCFHEKNRFQSGLSCLQLGCHILGKYYGSVTSGCINL